MGVAQQVSDVDQLQSIIARHQELEQTVQELGEKVTGLKQELATANTELKKLEVFRPLLEDQAQYWTLTVEDRGVTQQLLGRALQVFGAAGNVNAAGEDAQRYARQKVDFITTACVREGVGPGWFKVFSKYIKGADRITNA